MNVVKEMKPSQAQGFKFINWNSCNELISSFPGLKVDRPGLHVTIS